MHCPWKAFSGPVDVHAKFWKFSAPVEAEEEEKRWQWQDVWQWQCAGAAAPASEELLLLLFLLFCAGCMVVHLVPPPLPSPNQTDCCMRAPLIYRLRVIGGLHDHPRFMCYGPMRASLIIRTYIYIYMYAQRPMGASPIEDIYIYIYIDRYVFVCVPPTLQSIWIQQASGKRRPPESMQD